SGRDSIVGTRLTRAHRRALAAVRVNEELPVVVDALELEAGFAEDLLRRVLPVETKIQGLLSDYLGILREAVLLFDHEVLIQLLRLLRDGDPLGVDNAFGQRQVEIVLHLLDADEQQTARLEMGAHVLESLDLLVTVRQVGTEQKLVLCIDDDPNTAARD